jgi:hypothetical protein
MFAFLRSIVRARCSSSAVGAFGFFSMTLALPLFPSPAFATTVLVSFFSGGGGGFLGGGEEGGGGGLGGLGSQGFWL